MRYGSVCSGIEAASVAWCGLGWKRSFLSEIEKFPRAVLAHHYPTTPLHGDFTTIRAGDYEPINLLVGGTPCQSFSIAGLRGGMDDQRGNLALEFLRLADRLRPEWILFENVPGVLSSGNGRDFGSFLGGLVECGYGFAYRVLDAQFFGLAQRRKRVFVVGYIGDWRPAGAVLFERESLHWNPTPRRKERKDVAPTISARTTGGGGLGTDFDMDGGLDQAPVHVCGTLNANGKAAGSATSQDAECGLLVSYAPALSRCDTTREGGRMDSSLETYVTHSLTGEGFDASEDGTGRGTPLVPLSVALRGRAGGATSEVGDDISGAPRAAGGGGDKARVLTQTVRRLTPRECERLMGFPDDYTAIPFRGKIAADGPRYKALGNSMAVPVMRKIGERIAMMDAIINE
jgi:DNA (cytosine-5)-methyltransferase 1